MIDWPDIFNLKTPSSYSRKRDMKGKWGVGIKKDHRRDSKEISLKGRNLERSQTQKGRPSLLWMYQVEVKSTWSYKPDSFFSSQCTFVNEIFVKTGKIAIKSLRENMTRKSRQFSKSARQPFSYPDAPSTCGNVPLYLAWAEGKGESQPAGWKCEGEWGLCLPYTPQDSCPLRANLWKQVSSCGPENPPALLINHLSGGLTGPSPQWTS